jgi:hypothetical protein
VRVRLQAIEECQNPLAHPVDNGSRPPAHPSRRAFLLLPLALALPACNTVDERAYSSDDNAKGGFFGWHFNAPFDTSDVKTVFVYFKSQSFRRDLEKQLTEAVTKEINLRTPYRVVQDHEKADTILKGVINSADKNLLVEAPTNLPRQLSAIMTVNVTWTHRIPTDVEKTRAPTQIQESYNFVPELGQTTLMAYGQVVESIAKQVVDMMEQPWFLEEDLQ